MMTFQLIIKWRISSQDTDYYITKCRIILKSNYIIKNKNIKIDKYINI